ncbi:unnamed protein product [Parnassius apollo]|uniref:(apollo) hypothetical protein n=1 Tax=Parnassius apollo TaxID=110799 RepID=A0A8S3WWI0_PARAO|nr:unnamed protein product [Parnassius apollo]
MFLDSFNITDMWITTLFKKWMKIMKKSLQTIAIANARNENIKISVCQHINSIPVKESHYVRQRTSKLYFEESLTFPKLYSLYIEWMTKNNPSDTKAIQEQYRRIFYKELNIEFFKPKKDQSLKCEVHEKPSELEKEITTRDYALHMANKCIIRQIKDNDKVEAKQSKKNC